MSGSVRCIRDVDRRKLVLEQLEHVGEGIWIEREAEYGGQPTCGQVDAALDPRARRGLAHKSPGAEAAELLTHPRQRRDVRPPHRPVLPPPGRASVIACGVGAAGRVGANGGLVSALPCTPQEHPGIPQPPKWGGRGEFPRKLFLSRPLPQSQRGEGRTFAHVAEAAGPPARFWPRRGTETRAVRFNEARRGAQARRFESFLPGEKTRCQKASTP